MEKALVVRKETNEVDFRELSQFSNRMLEDSLFLKSRFCKLEETLKKLQRQIKRRDEKVQRRDGTIKKIKKQLARVEKAAAQESENVWKLRTKALCRILVGSTFEERAKKVVAAHPIILPDPPRLLQ